MLCATSFFQTVSVICAKVTGNGGNAMESTKKFFAGLIAISLTTWSICPSLNGNAYSAEIDYKAPKSKAEAASATTPVLMYESLHELKSAKPEPKPEPKPELKPEQKNLPSPCHGTPSPSWC